MKFHELKLENQLALARALLAGNIALYNSQQAMQQFSNVISASLLSGKEDDQINVEAIEGMLSVWEEAMALIPELIRLGLAGNLEGIIRITATANESVSILLDKISKLI